MSLALFLHPQFIFIAKQSSIIWTHYSFVYQLMDIQIVLCSSDDLEALMHSVTVDMCFRISRVCTMGRTTGTQSFWFALLKHCQPISQRSSWHASLTSLYCPSSL